MQHSPGATFLCLTAGRPTGVEGARMRNHRPLFGLSLALTLLALSGCATQEVAPDPDDYVIAGNELRPNSALLFGDFASTSATWPEALAALGTANPKTWP